jgi:hypothetical protein
MRMPSSQFQDLSDEGHCGLPDGTTERHSICLWLERTAQVWKVDAAETGLVLRFEPYTSSKHSTDRSLPNTLDLMA